MPITRTLTRRLTNPLTFSVGGRLAFASSTPSFIAQYSPLSAFSLQDLTGTNPNVARVRRSSDNAEQDFTAPELTDGTLTDWVNGYLNTLPLDTASASAAYSLRYVRTAYTGDVVRVRRDSDNAELDFNPTEITDGTMATWIGANNGFVTTWYDQSGNSNDATQATAANQPKIYDSVSGLITENGEPAIEFVSANTNYLEYPSSVVINQPLTTFAVARDTGLTDAANLLFDSNLGTNRLYIARIATGFEFCASNPGTPNLLQVANNNRNLFYGLANTTNSTLALNGEAGSTGDIGTNNLAGLTLGSIRPVTSRQSYSFNGYMQEFIIYDSNQSSNRATIEGNINKYYDIYSADGLVTTWYDQSGNGNDFTQSTASSQPKIVSAGVLVTGTNGLPAVELDGTDDNLRSAATFTGHATFDCYTAMEVGSESLYILYSEFSSGARRSFIAQSASNSTNIYDGFGTPALYANGSLQSPANRGDVFTAHAGQKIMTYLGADTSTWANGYLSFFGTAEYAGKIQEMVFFNTDSSGNRAAIETSINSRWSMY